MRESMMSEKQLYRVVVTGDSLAPEAMKLLEGACRVVFAGPYPDPPKLAELLRRERAQGLILRTGKATAEVLQASPDLRIVAKHGVGYDSIDVPAATSLRIPIMISATANFESVAEHALGLMLCLAKDFPRMDARMHQGFWDKTQYRGVELFRKTLGVIGFGRIGRRVSQLAGPLQMKILISDPYIPEESIPAGIERVSRLEPLLEQADIVTLHCPLTEETRNLIGKSEFPRMKKTAFLINTARGGIVDEEALITALHGGQIAGAGIDTFGKEPPEDLRRLCEAGKLVLTPHTAASTDAAVTRMGMEAAQNTLTILEGKPPDIKSVVNPEVL
jgi:D-3-phosphoglycerate dehydrogenase